MNRYSECELDTNGLEVDGLELSSNVYKEYTLSDNTRYVSLVLNPYQGHIFTGTGENHEQV